LFEARAGESLVFDLAATSIGSKANATLTLFDENGALLASNNGFDGGDPLLNFKIPTTGRYRVRIAERTDAGSKEHSIALHRSFPVVFGCFPLASEPTVNPMLNSLFQSSAQHVSSRQSRGKWRNGCAGGPGEIPQPPRVKTCRQRHPRTGRSRTKRLACTRDANSCPLRR